MLRMKLGQMFFRQAVKTEQDVIGRCASQMIADIVCENIDERWPIIERWKEPQTIGVTKLSGSFLCFNYGGFKNLFGVFRVEREHKYLRDNLRILSLPCRSDRGIAIKHPAFDDLNLPLQIL